MGTVTLDGAPLPQGSIVFDSADGAGGSSIGEIIDGKFTCLSELGRKHVRISSSRETDQLGPYGEKIIEEVIPPKFNSKSTLTAEITSETASQLKFELTSK